MAKSHSHSLQSLQQQQQLSSSSHKQYHHYQHSPQIHGKYQHQQRRRPVSADFGKYRSNSDTSTTNSEKNSLLSTTQVPSLSPKKQLCSRQKVRFVTICIFIRFFNNFFFKFGSFEIFFRIDFDFNCKELEKFVSLDLDIQLNQNYTEQLISLLKKAKKRKTLILFFCVFVDFFIKNKSTLTSSNIYKSLLAEPIKRNCLWMTSDASTSNVSPSRTKVSEDDAGKSAEMNDLPATNESSLSLQDDKDESSEDSSCEEEILEEVASQSSGGAANDNENNDIDYDEDNNLPSTTNKKSDMNGSTPKKQLRYVARTDKLFYFC